MSTADLRHVSWRKSSYSGGEGGQCVELADLGNGVAVRDSKDPEGPALLLTRNALATLFASTP